MRRLIPTLCWIVLLAVCGESFAAQRGQNLFRGARVGALNHRRNYEPEKAVDGAHYRASTWMPAGKTKPPYLLEVELDKYCDIDSMVIYTGIPENERKENEQGQAAGYWNMKNFIIQYWDDANWSDIDETLTTENRLDRVVFHFRPAITSFRFRIRSTDGEPIRIIEFEGYGAVNATMPSPSTTSRVVEQQQFPTSVTARVEKEVVGRTMRYVGYNQGYYVPESNVSSWLEYSGVNAVRLWMPLNFLVPEEAVDQQSKPTTLEAFESLKAALRRQPRRSGIDWKTIERQADALYESTNTMVYGYALDELRRMGIEVLVQSTAYKKTPDWASKWLLWQRMYALAYYSALRGGVEMYAMQNEPNHRHAGPIPLEEWINMMRVASDAVHCAVADASRDGAGPLKGMFVGPVTAGTNTNWWARIASAEGVDYAGRPMEEDLVDLFSTHSYNLPASGYAGKVASIDRILRKNHSKGATKPVIFTEIGRWMNAYLIDKEETMDSPSLFTEWAGIYTYNMREGGYGMWAFKFANTASSTYPNGIKSGHHHIWKGRRFAEDQFENHALRCAITASSQDGDAAPTRVADGIKTTAHGWQATSDREKWLLMELPEPTTLGGMAIYTGSEGGEFTAPDRIRSLRVEVEQEGQWHEVYRQKACRYAQLFPRFEKPILTRRIRISTTDKGTSCIREVKLFGEEFLTAGRESYDIGGAQRTAEVVRLFAKGFRDQRPLLRCNRSSEDPELDCCIAADSTAGMLYGWLVQRRDTTYSVSIDLSALGLANRTVVAECVRADRYGDATCLRVDGEGALNLSLAPKSVVLLSIPMEATSERRIAATRVGTLRGDGSAETAMRVTMNSAKPNENAVALMTFPLTAKEVQRASRVLLRFEGAANREEPFRFHLYASPMPMKKISAEALAIDPAEVRMLEPSKCWFMVGESSLSVKGAARIIDLTDFVKRHADCAVTVALVRELREAGDDYDKGVVAAIAPNAELIIIE